MMHPDLHTLTGAYALDALDPQEREAFEAHLPACPTCQAEVDGFLATAAMLGSAAAAPPPAHLKGVVLDTVARTRQDPPPAAAPPTPRPTAPARRRPPRSWRDRVLLPAAAALAVAVVGLALVVSNLDRRLDAVVPAGDVAAVVAADDLQSWEATLPDGSPVRVVYSAARGEGWFLADGMATPEPGSVYELWLIDDRGAAPAGLFTSSHGQVAHAFTGDVSGVQAIGVTVEPASGSPQPTTDPIVLVEL